MKRVGEVLANRCRILFLSIMVLIFVTTNAVAIPFTHDVKCNDTKLGQLKFDVYETGTKDGLGGGKFTGGFILDKDFKCPPGLYLADFRWIQLIVTDHPSPETLPKTGYIDPGNRPDEDPFYWDTAKGTSGDFYWYKNWQNKDGYTYKFDDFSTRYFSDAPVDWDAELALVCTWWKLLPFPFCN